MITPDIDDRFPAFSFNSGVRFIKLKAFYYPATNHSMSEGI